MDLLILWLVAPVLILVMTGPAAGRLYIALLEKNNPRGLAALAAGLVLAALVVGVFITYTFSDFFPGIGCFISLLSPIAAIITFLYFRLRAKRVYERIADWGPGRRWFAAGSLLIPLLQLSAPLVGYAYGQTCDALNRQAAAPLIAALKAYKDDTGSYLPVGGSQGSYQGTLDFLVPAYLDLIPQRACMAATFDRPDPIYPEDDDWNLYACGNTPGDPVLLMVPILGSDSQQIYNLDRGLWSRGNAMDGYCNYLP